MKQGTRSLKIFFLFAIINSLYFSASGQNNALKSRVALVSNENKTNIWVSDFPKRTSIVIMDGDFNLISIVSTNDYGAAYISLPIIIKKEVFVKTLNGEIIVSNKPVTTGRNDEQNIVATVADNLIKS